MLTKEDKILIKNVWESKKYGVTRLIKEFPNKKWSKCGLEDFLKRLRSTGSIERTPGRPSGRCGGVVCQPVLTLKAHILSMMATSTITMSKWQL